ncbi:MAG TPA: hypothetical protein VIL30_12570 [Ramlibacter sp.]
MTFKFPPLSIPRGTRIAALMTVSPKKSGKTTTLRVAANEFLDAGFELVILQHDDHDLLDCYAPTTHLPLARASQILRGKTMIDLKNHGALSDALLSLADHPNWIVMLDGSAPGSERISSILNAGRFNKWLADRNIFVMFLVPLRAIQDSALGALSVMEELQLVMSDHFIIPVPICDPEDLDLLPRDHPFFRVMGAARHGVIHMPALSEDIAAGLERLKRPLSEVADPDSEEALAYIMQASGHDRLVAGMIAEGAQQLITAFEGAIAPLELAPAP